MWIYNLISFFGIFFLIFIAYIFSKDRKNINYRVVFWGIFLQFLFAFFLLKIRFGILLFSLVNRFVIKILSFANVGSYFVFGPLSISPSNTGPLGEKSLGFILAFQGLLTVIFFSSLMALLYEIGIMQKITGLFSKIFSKSMKISGAESFCSASNIFVGIESFFTIKPYLAGMTPSELCTILTASMATIASTVMGVYVSFLSKDFPTIAGHLALASILSAPAAILFSKILYPEDKTPKTLSENVCIDYKKHNSVITAIINGSYDGVKLLVGIIALLISFLGLLAMFNYIIGFIFRLIGNFFGINLELSLEKILSFIFYPFTFFMGVPLEDIPKVSKLLGERIILTELVSYKHLSEYIITKEIVNLRSVVLASYALCGFSHIASLAIFVGGLVSLIPDRTKEIASLGIRALFASNLACLLTGCVVGVFFL